MEFYIYARVFKEPPKSLPMQEVWQISDSELSEIGTAVSDLMKAEESPPHDLWEHACWICQAIIEFQDLQDMPIPHKGRFFQINYLFAEGLATLREAVATGLNGYFHASFGMLRAALEMFTFHYWWKEKLRFSGSYEPFYAWAEGDRTSPPFRNVIDESFQNLDPPEYSITKEGFNRVYSKLCAYAHKPIIKEAITSIRGTNVPTISEELLGYWAKLLHESAWCILHIALNRSPICLFPQVLYRKFGFSPPVGMFFDTSNFIPLRRVLGEDLTLLLKQYYERRDPPLSQLEWFRGLPDLDENEILATWEDEEDIDDADAPFEERVFQRYAMMKGKMRAFMMAITYGGGGPELSGTRSII